MRVSAIIKLDGLETIEDLRRALSTVEFYQCPHLYNLFCYGVDSGHLRGSLQNEGDIVRLEELLSVSADTHLRAELWYSLSEYDFAHNIGREHREERVKRFKQFGVAVREGRSDYGDAAWEKRQQVIAMYEDDENEDAAGEHPPAFQDKVDDADASMW